jgi:hypothetical protein
MTGAWTSTGRQQMTDSQAVWGRSAPGAAFGRRPDLPMSERDLVVPKYVHDLGSSARTGP